MSLTRIADAAQRLFDNNVPVIPILPGTKRPNIVGWTAFARKPQTQQDIDAFIDQYPAFGCGIPTGKVIGVDIDVLDKDLSDKCKQLAFDILGPTSFIRIGREPKTMLVYRTEETFSGWKNHPLEVFAEGQQFVAHAIHPDTGQPYHWPLDNLLDSDFSELPLVTEAKLRQWTTAAKAALTKPASVALNFDATQVTHTATGAPVAQGERNSQAASLVGQWINAGYTDANIEAMLAEWNSNNTPPLTDAELRTIRRSVRQTAIKRNGTPAPVPVSDILVSDQADDDADDTQPFLPAKQFPQHLIENLPGALGWITDYINRTSFKEQPVLALAAAIPLVGAVTGRQCELVDWQTRTNIYTLGVAVSGSGKDRARDAVKDILFAAGRDGYIGTEDVASDTGFLMDLKDNPSNIALIDEFGRTLRLIAQPNAPVHLKGIIDLLLRLRTASRSIHKSKSYADRTRNFTINQPNCCLYGTSVPDNFYGSLTQEAISDGFLSRMLLFDTFDHDPPMRSPQRTDVPPELIEWINAWCSRPTDGGILGVVGGHPVVRPIIVGLTMKGRQMIKDYMARMDDKKKAMRGRKLDHLYVRAPENALKLILIRAVAHQIPGSGHGLLATDEDVKWGLELAEFCTDHLAEQASRHISDNGFGKSQKTFLREIERAGQRGMTRRDMSRNPQLSKFKPKEQEEILGALTTAELVILTEIKGGVGRPRLAYVIAKGGTMH